jgi:GNAT superfamily N-acetyltransferase
MAARTAIMSERTELDGHSLTTIELDPDRLDWHELHSLVTAAYAYMHGRIDPPSSLLTMTPSDFEQKAADEHLIVAWRDGRLVGCVFCAPAESWLYIGKFAVAPGLQRSGVGRLLIDASRRFAEEAGLGGLELDTRIELTENHRAFGRLGFVEVAKRSHPGYTKVTCIRMRSLLGPTLGSVSTAEPINVPVTTTPTRAGE